MRTTDMHMRVTTGVIRRTEPSWFEDRPAFRGELTASWGHGREVHYFPNYNFTRGRPEPVPTPEEKIRRMS